MHQWVGVFKLWYIIGSYCYKIKFLYCLLKVNFSIIARDSFCYDLIREGTKVMLSLAFWLLCIIQWVLCVYFILIYERVAFSCTNLNMLYIIIYFSVTICILHLVYKNKIHSCLHPEGINESIWVFFSNFSCTAVPKFNKNWSPISNTILLKYYWEWRNNNRSLTITISSWLFVCFALFVSQNLEGCLVVFHQNQYTLKPAHVRGQLYLKVIFSCPVRQNLIWI